MALQRICSSTCDDVKHHYQGQYFGSNRYNDDVRNYSQTHEDYYQNGYSYGNSCAKREMNCQQLLHAKMDEVDKIDDRKGDSSFGEAFNCGFVHGADDAF